MTNPCRIIYTRYIHKVRANCERDLSTEAVTNRGKEGSSEQCLKAMFPAKASRSSRIRPICWCRGVGTRMAGIKKKEQGRHKRAVCVLTPPTAPTFNRTHRHAHTRAHADNCPETSEMRPRAAPFRKASSQALPQLSAYKTATRYLSGTSRT